MVYAPRDELYQCEESPAMNQLKGSTLLLIFSVLSMLIITNCTGSKIESSTVQVYIKVDQQIVDQSLPQGSTVSDAIQAAGIEVGLSDKVSPPEYTALTDNLEIKITRVSERLEVVSMVLPFERQIVKNESIPEGETHLLQPGKNGLEEITYRVIEEEGIETARVSIRRIVLEEPVPEIMMVGTQQGYTPLTFPGTIVYVSSQNAWLIEGETGSRRPVTSTGDLDGRILELSPDGRWLLFTRKFEDLEEGINSLWLLDVADPQSEPMDLKAQNIIHFADWSPLSPTAVSRYIIAYSTVEPRPSAPGWQANNDLRIIEITNAGTVARREIVLETNSGGQYGWWGTSFAWSPDGDVMAYSRADSIGIVDFEEKTTEEFLEVTPYQTGGDWAWLPPIAWGFDSQILYFVGHGKPSGLEKPEASQEFNLMALYRKQSTMGPLLHQCGMFAHLALSPESDIPSGERTQVLAILQAVDPLESETSRYRLLVMDLDGSNQQSIFPPIGELGLEPGKIVWAPDGSHIATLYQSNLWVIDPGLGIKQRITADGQTIAFDWSQ
jgi:hypothetical protein